MRYAEFCARWEREGKRDYPLYLVMEKHTPAKGAEAAWWASRLFSHGILNGYRVFDRSRDVPKLRALDEAIRKIAEAFEDDAMSYPAFERLYVNLFHCHSELITDNGQEVDSQDRGSPSSDDNSTVSYGKMLQELADNAAKIQGVIARTLAEIEASPMTKATSFKINERGVALVDASRFILRLATSNAPPSRDLNPASKFGAFLYDVFEATKTPGDPRSAFRAWVRERENGRWSLDDAP